MKTFKINKLLLSFVVYLCSFIFVYGQGVTADYRNNFRIGVKGGVSYSNIYDSSSDVFNSDAKFGLTGGAFLKIPLGTYIGIQPELLFTQKGFKGEGNLLGNAYNFKRTTTFVEVPLLLAIKPIRYITLLVGPQFSYLARERYEFISTGNNFDQEEEFKLDNVRKNIFGIVGGFDINLSNLNIGARLGWDIQNNRGDGTSTSPRYKNVCSQITIGYQL